ncbi:hypothetical protein [Desulfovibrio inopinatus]|uniref:hypothetical protein n=1 Tax=Desulfovibrio inopinatus TaxID=102109 RepID=UPI0003FAEB39|nr:hypothetical protein [Desulfovibrio inopinatus]
MRDYGVVYSKFWLREDVMELSDKARLLFLYLLTGPHTTPSGCFRLPQGYAAADLGWGMRTVSKRFEELSSKGFVLCCPNTDWILIPNFLKHNPIPNPNCGKSIARQLELLPRTFGYVNELIESLRPFREHFPEGYVEGYVNGSANGSVNGSRNGSTNGLGNGLANHRTKNKEQEEEKNIYRARTREADPPDSQAENPTSPEAPAEGEPPGIEGYSLEFLEFWEAYPNKSSQDDAWIAWLELKKKRQHPGICALHTALLAQGKSARWQQNGGQFIPDPANWLRKRRWKDQLPAAVEDDHVTHDVTAMSRGHSRDGPVPKTYAQCQDAEQRDQALIALEYMRGQNHAKQKCDHRGTGEILPGLPTA